jgi:hypothetical protein
MSANSRYIEKLPNIKLDEKIADMKWIHAAYRIFKSAVKPKARKMRLWENKKGESIGSDSPSDIGI